MNKIKFSHNYLKIADVKKALLIEVIPCKFEDFSKIFIKIDTAYYEDGKIDFYKLPKKGAAILLIFRGETSEGEYKFFTTVRAAWPSSKVEYYKKRIDQDFEIVITKKQL